jgi:hypothetical protein
MTRYALLVVLALALLPGRLHAQADPAGPLPSDDPRAVVAAVSAAFNRHDATGMVYHFAPTTQVMHVMGTSFSEDVRADTWQDRFEHLFVQVPDIRREVLVEVADGPFVLHHYRIHAGGRASSTMWVYEVQRGKVVRLWHFDAPSASAAAAHDH